MRVVAIVVGLALLAFGVWFGSRGGVDLWRAANVSREEAMMSNQPPDSHLYEVASMWRSHLERGEDARMYFAEGCTAGALGLALLWLAARFPSMSGKTS